MKPADKLVIMSDFLHGKETFADVLGGWKKNPDNSGIIIKELRAPF